MVPDTISVDQNKCISCGICATVCPFTVLQMKDGFPRLNPEKQCLHCLHCAAACPQNAIMYGGSPSVIPGTVPSVPAHFDGELSAFLMQRRSYRHFTGKPVDDSLLLQALNLADYAPSTKNQHPVSYLIVSSRAQSERIMEHILHYLRETGLSPEVVAEYDAGNNVVMGTASTLIMAFCGPDALNPQQDTALALSSAELYLQSKGVGTCWAGYLTRLSNAIPALRELFSLPEGHQFTGALMAGYPESEEYLGIPNRTRPSGVRWIK